TGTYDSSGNPTWYSPVGYSIVNQAGRPEAQGSIYFSGGKTTSAPSTPWVSTATSAANSNPVGLLSAGTIASLSTTVCDEPGLRATESRVYFSIPSSGSWPGSTSYYDSTSYTYDDMGRKLTTTIPSGTITHTVFDELGRVTETWVGTND